MNLDCYLKSQTNVTASVFARSLGISAPLLSQWRKGVRRVSVHHCLAIERATGGRVTRGELRPHDAHLIWPDIASGAGPDTGENPETFQDTFR